MYDSEGVIYTYKAKKKGNHIIELPVNKAGFVRADVRWDLKGFKWLLFNLVMTFYIPAQAFMKDVPPMVEAICSPIWFEK